MKVRLKTTESSEFLEKDKDYVVYAIYIGAPAEYMIHVESFPSAPYAVNANCVDIVDNRISKYWVVNYGGKKNNSIISFSEWATDKYFYQNVVDGQEASIVWRSKKLQLDNEFDDPNLPTATNLGDAWLQCCNCADAWEQSQRNVSIVTCHHCGARQNMPST